MLGVVSLTFAYSDSNPLAADAEQTVNFNFYEAPGPTTLSDTLSITFTGKPAPDGTNMHVGVEWRSQSTDGVQPPVLPNAHNIDEITFANADLFSFINGDTGLSDFHIRTNSVSEPSSVVPMGLGALYLGGLVLRRRRQS